MRYIRVFYCNAGEQTSVQSPRQNPYDSGPYASLLTVGLLLGGVGVGAALVGTSFTAVNFFNQAFRRVLCTSRFLQRVRPLLQIVYGAETPLY